MRKINFLAVIAFLTFLTSSVSAEEQKVLEPAKEQQENENKESSDDDLQDEEVIEEEEKQEEIPVAPTPPAASTQNTQNPSSTSEQISPQTSIKATETQTKSPNVQVKKVEEVKVSNAPIIVKNNIDPFTGKITKNKVRLRLQPNFDSVAVRELTQGELVVVYGKTDDFYAVKPSKDIKAYIYRTYVLDNVVEGTHVNVRLKPDLDAQVVAQLNSGDRVEGHIFSENNKWLEITIPEAARFFIAQEYVEKVGDANFKLNQEKRQDEVNRLLATTKAISDAEMLKPFDKIIIEGIVANYKKIMTDYKDFPEATAKAQEYLNSLQYTYTNKKLAYLEQQNLESTQLQKQNKELSEELEQNRNRISQLQNQMQQEKRVQNQLQTPVEASKTTPPSDFPTNMASWIPVENTLYNSWSQQTGKENPTEFYEEQKSNSFILKGIVEVYNRPVKNKPGDFMLVNSASKLPIAYLYSTQVNLQNFVGHEVTVRVTPRNNFNYAFPAYFVFSVE